MTTQLRTPRIRVKSKVKGRADVKAATADLIRKYERAFRKAFVEEVKNILMSGSVAQPLIEKTLSILEGMQANYWGSKLSSEDPTALAREEQKAAVTSEILKNFKTAAEQFSSRSMSINLTHLSDEFLGLTGYSKTSTKRICWLHFFLFGSLDPNLMWVNNSTAKVLFGDSPGGGLGRFGEGFLVAVSEEARPVFISKLRKAGLLAEGESLGKFMHPQSGKKGHNYFKGIFSTIDANTTIIQPAIARASARIKNNMIIAK